MLFLLSSEQEFYGHELIGNSFDAFDGANRQSYISDSSITRRKIPSDGSILDDTDSEDDTHKNDPRRNGTYGVNKRVSRDDNMVQINRSMINDLNAEILQGTYCNIAVGDCYFTTSFRGAASPIG